jgi:hypothetical protein
VGQVLCTATNTIVFFPPPPFYKKFKSGGRGGGRVVYFDSCTPWDPSPSSWVNPDLYWYHGKNHCWVVTRFRGLEPEVTESELGVIFWNWF